MKAIITIGYTDILLPDVATASAVLKALSKGIVVRDHLYCGEVLLRSEELSLEMRVVPAKTRFKHEKPSEPEHAPVAEKPATASRKAAAAEEPDNVVHISPTPVARPAKPTKPWTKRQLRLRAAVNELLLEDTAQLLLEDEPDGPLRLTGAAQLLLEGGR